MSEVDNIPGLKIEANDDGTYTLEQEWTGNVDRVAVHAVHVRHLAERLGLIVQSGTECPIGKSSAELQRENDRHRRNLLRIRDRALHLQSDFAKHADWDHADLLHEMTLINGVVDLLDLACDGFTGSLSTADERGAERNPITPPPDRSPATPADPSPKPAALQLEIQA